MAAAAQLEALVGPKQDTLNQTWKQGMQTHQSSHLLHTTTQPPTSINPSHPPTDKSSFGFKMLMKMGWSEGRGLGKELQGAATHVTVAKKTDSAGLGTVKDETGNLGWTETSVAFDSVLSRLNARYGNDAAAAKKAEKRRRKKEKVRWAGVWVLGWMEGVGPLDRDGWVLIVFTSIFSFGRPLLSIITHTCMQKEKERAVSSSSSSGAVAGKASMLLRYVWS